MALRVRAAQAEARKKGFGRAAVGLVGLAVGLAVRVTIVMIVTAPQNVAC